jgi:hypothetical protein
MGKFRVWFPQRKLNIALLSGDVNSHTSSERYSRFLRSCSCIIRDATKLAQWHVSCMTPYNLCKLTPPSTRGQKTSLSSIPSSDLKASTAACPRSQAFSMCATTSSAVPPGTTPAHSKVTIVTPPPMPAPPPPPSSKGDSTIAL